MDSGRIDVVAEIEKRKKEHKLDENRIFTCLANQARLDSLHRIQKHKDDHKLPLTVNAKPKYMSHHEKGNGMIRELEEILNRVQLTRSSSTNINPEREKLTVQSIVRNQSADALKKKPKKQKPVALPSLRQRYGNITETWIKGPIDIPKDRYFDLTDARIYGNVRDPRARQLRQQTKCLMNSMQMASRQSRIHQTCRKRVVEASQRTGEDHVIEALDQYVSDTANVPGQGRVLLQSALTQVVYPPRKARRKPNARIDEVWENLRAPKASKLWFKLLSQGHIDPQPSARDTARSSAEALPPPDPEGGTLINRIEHLNDLAHTVDVFRVLLLMWLREGLPQMFSSNELLQPLADMLRVVGMTRTAKNTSEEMTVWLQSSLDNVWVLCGEELTFWKSLCEENDNKLFLQYFEELEQALLAMVQCGSIWEKERAAAAEEEEEGGEGEAQEMDCLTSSSLWSGGIGESLGGGHSERRREGWRPDYIGSRRRKKRGVMRDDDDGHDLTEEGTAPPLEAPADSEDTPDPLAVVSTHPRNARSSRVIQKVRRIEEVLDIGQLLQYHTHKPNLTLLRQLSTLHNKEGEGERWGEGEPDEV